jgi:hypothetical protein
VVLGSETADAVQVERSERKAEQHGHLGEAHHPYEAAGQGVEETMLVGIQVQGGGETLGRPQAAGPSA